MLPLALDNLPSLPSPDPPASSPPPSATPFEDYLRSARAPGATGSPPAHDASPSAGPGAANRPSDRQDQANAGDFASAPRTSQSQADAPADQGQSTSQGQDRSGNQADEAAAGKGQTTSADEKEGEKDEAAATVEFSAAAVAAHWFPCTTDRALPGGARSAPRGSDCSSSRRWRRRRFGGTRPFRVES